MSALTHMQSDPALSKRNVPTALPLLRRLHTYLGIALLPWLLMYAVAAFVLNHQPLMDSWFRTDRPDWTCRLQQEYHHPLPSGPQVTPQQLRQVAQEILNDLGMGNQAFWANQPDPNRLVIHAFRFLGATRITYQVDRQQVTIDDQAFRFDRFLAGMHIRGGFQQAPLLTKVWAGIVDLVALSLVFWVISGLYIWWKAHRRHAGGALVLAAGAICYVLLVALL